MRRPPSNCVNVSTRTKVPGKDSQRDTTVQHEGAASNGRRQLRKAGAARATFPIMLATSASVEAADNVQEIYDTLSSKDKKLFWIDGTDQRFQGYDGSRDKFLGSVS